MKEEELNKLELMLGDKRFRNTLDGRACAGVACVSITQTTLRALIEAARERNALLAEKGQ